MDFEPLSFDHCQNSVEANGVIMRLIWGSAGSGNSKGVTMLKLFRVAPELFNLVRSETLMVLSEAGQELSDTHPTTRYVSDQDSSWKPKQASVWQYSLYNSRDDFLYNDDDHRWSGASRHFNKKLVHIPAFAQRYFQSTELQNFRLNAMFKDGGLGQHREKIIGIPGREMHYKLRFHLPVITNPGVRFLMDGQEHQMEEGWVYLFNQSCMHGVTNAGEALRAHLVWDCYLNNYVVRERIQPAL